MAVDVETKSISSQRSYELVVEQAENAPESNSGEDSDHLTNSAINGEENDEKEAYQLETEEDPKISYSNGTHIQISKRRNTVFNRRIIPLRVAIILMAGGSRLPSLFLSVFLRNRGMSLIEISAVISVTSISQIICASVSGIVADKTGNSKPVLIFLIAAGVTFSVCLILTPSMKQDKCDKLKFNINGMNEAENVKKDMHNNCSCNGSNEDFPHAEILNETTVTELRSPSKLMNKNQSDEESSPDLYLLNTSAYDEFTENCSLSCSVKRNCRTEGIVLVMYYVITFLYITCGSAAYRFMDVTIMLLVKEYNSNYGRERIFGVMSDTVVSVMVAFGMDLVDSDTSSPQKYDLVYWICAVLMVLAIIASCNFKAKINAPGKRLTAKALILVKNIEFIAFVIVMLITGMVNNFFVYFNLVLLEDINAEKILFGLNNAVFSFCGVPGLLTSKWWLPKFGACAIILIFLFSNSLIGFSYFFLQNPWLSLILEGTRGFVFNIFIVAVLQHCQDIAPLGLFATVAAVSTTIHFAFGRAVATLGGGLLMNALGSRATYRLLGIVCILTSLAYGVFLFIYRRKRKHEINVTET